MYTQTHVKNKAKPIFGRRLIASFQVRIFVLLPFFFIRIHLKWRLQTKNSAKCQFFRRTLNVFCTYHEKFYFRITWPLIFRAPRIRWRITQIEFHEIFFISRSVSLGTGFSSLLHYFFFNMDETWLFNMLAMRFLCYANFLFLITFARS